MRIGVSYVYTFLNAFITIIGSLFCLLITHQKEIATGGITFAAIMLPLLILSFIFTLVLKCKRKSICSGVAMTNVQHFDIKEWDVIEVEQEEDQEIEMGEIFAS
jgi:ABC-type sugar transport system permease subunit